MLQPIRSETYKFEGVPLTETEKKRAKKIGMPTEEVRGVFRYRGFQNQRGLHRKVLVFKEPARTEKGTTYSGREISMTIDDFDQGADLGKIKGRTKKNRKAVSK